MNSLFLFSIVFLCDVRSTHISKDGAFSAGSTPNVKKFYADDPVETSRDTIKDLGIRDRKRANDHGDTGTKAWDLS